MRSLLLAALTATLAFQDKTQPGAADPDTVLKDFKQAYAKAKSSDAGRAEAVRSLGRAPHAKTMTALSQVLLGDGSGQEVPAVRIAAAETIGASFSAIPNSWTPLATLARTRDKKIVDVRIATVKAMGRLAAPASLKTLQDFVDDKPFEMAREAIDALPGIPDKSSVPVLLKLLREVERVPEGAVVPDLPFNGFGVGGLVADDARAEQNERRRVLLDPVLGALKALTEQNYGTFKEYQKWWSANGSRFQVAGKKK
jgi:hypothetical protein